MTIILFVPKYWNIDPNSHVTRQLFDPIFVNAEDRVPYRGRWEHEVGRLKKVCRDYIIAPWLGDIYHSCETPFAVIGELSDDEVPIGLADMYIKESDLDQMLENWTRMKNVLTAKKKIRLVKWPGNG